MSGAAFAQSNVTIYGIADVGYIHQGSASTDGNGGKADSRNAIDSGVQSGSRLGFKGTEDLGNGLKASFVYEMGVNIDQGNSAQGGLEYGRQAYLALSSNYGTVAGGRQYTPQFNMMAAYDPFAAGFTGVVNRGEYYGSQQGMDTYNLTAGGRVNNLLAYVSPSFSGFNVIAGYSWDALGNEASWDSDRAVNQGNGNAVVSAVAQNTGLTGDLIRTAARGYDPKVSVWAINPNYTNGPIAVGFNYHKVGIDGMTGVSSTDVTTWDLAGSYDFGMVKVSLMYGRDNADSTLENLTGIDDIRKWMFGLSAPVGANGKVLFSYKDSKINVNGAPDASGDQWSIGYTHNLSKRTNLYVAYSNVDTNNAGEGVFGTGQATATRAATLGGVNAAGTAFSAAGAAVGGSQYETALTMGVRHSF